MNYLSMHYYSLLEFLLNLKKILIKKPLLKYFMIQNQMNKIYEPSKLFIETEKK